jgi:glycosyltransferase involved in cell wall biosynthesis
MQKVLMVISGRGFGGTKNAFIQYAYMLLDSGFELTLVVRKNSKIYLTLQRTHPRLAQKCDFLQSYFRFDFCWARYLAKKEWRRLQEKHQPDVIICHKPIDVYFAKISAIPAKIIGIAHGFYCRNFMLFIAHADQILAVSNAVRNFLAQKIANKQIQLLYNAIAMPKILPKQDLETPVIGTMCVFRRKKNIPLLLRACQILKRRKKDFQLIIAGDGRQKWTIKACIYLFGLRQHVQLLPWVENKADFFSKVDIFTVTSNTESFNMALIEAMSYQTCVLATKCGGPEEIINDKKTGLLVDVRDEEQLADALQKLLNDKKLRNQLVDNAYKEVRQKFNIDLLQHSLAKFVKN